MSCVAVIEVYRSSTGKYDVSVHEGWPRYDPRRPAKSFRSLDDAIRYVEEYIRRRAVEVEERLRRMGLD